MDNWLLITISGILLFTTMFGLHRGFIKLSVSVVSLILTLVIVQIATPYVSKFFKEATPLYRTVQSSILEGLGAEGVPEENNLSVSEETQLINGLSFPGSLKEALVENNNSEVYKILGIDRFKDYISSYMANIIINAISFLLSFVVIYAIFKITVFALDIVSHLPGIHGVNKLAGAALGFFEGMIFIWLLCLFATAFSSTAWGKAVFVQIERNKILSIIYDYNLFTKFIMSLVSNLL